MGTIKSASKHEVLTDVTFASDWGDRTVRFSINTYTPTDGTLEVTAAQPDPVPPVLSGLRSFVEAISELDETPLSTIIAEVDRLLETRQDKYATDKPFRPLETSVGLSREQVEVLINLANGRTLEWSTRATVTASPDVAKDW